tara:strand:+ start:151 stop:414 length:264 start_codon:yes stop_codon:yes gene_type:complete
MTNQNQKLVGNLTEDEIKHFNDARLVANQLMQKIGTLEVQKTRLIAELDVNESQAQELLSSVKNRLELTDDNTWRITSEGQIFTLES